MTDDKNVRRGRREEAVTALNELAQGVGIDTLHIRAPGAAVKQLFLKLLQNIGDDELDNLRVARTLWCENGGQALPEVERKPAPTGDDEAPVPGHGTLQQSFYKAKGGFRLQSKAFLLTFNCLAFVHSQELWSAFKAWVQDRCQKFKAKFWSCTMEASVHSHDVGRVHLHAYFSWTNEKGVDHSTTDHWCFQGVRPRVDINKENRGAYEWKRACHHGHFYVQVSKLGTLESATNCPPWDGDWIPEAWWVTSLWKQHKLDHDSYLALSLKLRDGHDRRKARWEKEVWLALKGGKRICKTCINI